jgi:hypothetical protein
MYSSPEARNHEIDFGATLSPIALRHLVDHSAAHLNVEWRDLPADAWHHKVKTAQGRTVPALETPDLRKHCARGGTRTGLQPLNFRHFPENLRNPAQSATSTARSEAQGVHIVHTLFFAHFGDLNRVA